MGNLLLGNVFLKLSKGIFNISSFLPPRVLILQLLLSSFLNTRAMKETFKSYMELLVSIALDPDTMQP